MSATECRHCDGIGRYMDAYSNSGTCDFCGGSGRIGDHGDPAGSDPIRPRYYFVPESKSVQAERAEQALKTLEWQFEAEHYL